MPQKKKNIVPKPHHQPQNHPKSSKNMRYTATMPQRFQSEQQQNSQSQQESSQQQKQFNEQKDQQNQESMEVSDSQQKSQNQYEEQDENEQKQASKDAQDDESEGQKSQKSKQQEEEQSQQQKQQSQNSNQDQQNSEKSKIEIQNSQSSEPKGKKSNVPTKQDKKQTHPQKSTPNSIPLATVNTSNNPSLHNTYLQSQQQKNDQIQLQSSQPNIAPPNQRRQNRNIIQQQVQTDDFDSHQQQGEPLIISEAVGANQHYNLVTQQNQVENNVDDNNNQNSRNQAMQLQQQNQPEIQIQAEAQNSQQNNQEEIIIDEDEQGDEIDQQQKKIKKQLEQLELQNKNGQKLKGSKKKSKKDKNKNQNANNEPTDIANSQKIKQQQSNNSQNEQLNLQDQNNVLEENDQQKVNKQEQSQNGKKDQQMLEDEDINQFEMYIHPYLSLIGSKVIQDFMEKKNHYKASQASDWATKISSSVLQKAYFLQIQAPDSQDQDSEAQYLQNLQRSIIANKFYKKIQRQLDQLVQQQNLKTIQLCKIFRMIKTFKTVTSCFILQKKVNTQTALNISSSCNWNKNKDGLINFSYDAKHSFVMLTLYGLENKSSNK